jgi:GNAT superfamily N-acetyltransferase
MATIRNATEADVDTIVKMARHFIAFAPHAAVAEYTDEDLAHAARSCMQHGLLIVAEQDGEIIGMLLGIVSGLWFAPRTLWASELAWWVEPAARGGTAGIRLVTAFQDWAREKGAKVVAMSSLHLDHDSRVGNVLERMGFSPSEHTYIKRIS